MALNWRVISAISASLNSSRARWATQRVCSSVKDMLGLCASVFVLRSSPRAKDQSTKTQDLDGWHGERPAFAGALDAAAADALDADAGAAHATVVVHDLHGLEVGLELPAADPGDLAADAAQVLRLAAPGIV